MIFCYRLERSLGVQCQVLSWFETYLLNSTYCIEYIGETSSVIDVFVLHSTRLCSRCLQLFALHTADLADLAAEYDIILHEHDTQLYLHCDSSSLAQSITMLKQFVTAIGNWMSTSLLKLNFSGLAQGMLYVEYLEMDRRCWLLGRGNTNAASSAHLLGVLYVCM